MFSKIKEVVKCLFGIGNSSNDSNASIEDALDEPREVTESSFEEELDDLGDPEVVADDLLDELER